MGWDAEDTFARWAPCVEVEPEPPRIYRVRRRRWPLPAVLVAAAGLATTAAAFSGSPDVRGAAVRGESREAVRSAETAPRIPQAKPINTTFAGITTFRGNATRTFYGEGPVPRSSPRILWRYPRTGGMCMDSVDEHGRERWCGVGWTGQPNVVVREDGRTEIRFGAFDGRYHFLDAATGEPLRDDLVTGDLAKGSATSDPDGYPLYYAGSRDNLLRVVALDRGRPTVLWSLDARRESSRWRWNDDWDAAPLVAGDYLLAGSENSRFYVVRLNRSYGRDGKVRVRPRVVVDVPGWDAELLRALGDDRVSIESSVALHEGIAYFANSGGLVQGWDLRGVLDGGRGKARRVFRFWTGDDTDATVVVDREGFLYVASELERGTERSRRVGQLVKLDPRRPRDPLVWSVAVPERGFEGKGGIWSTPALYGPAVVVATNAGGLLGVDRRSGRVLWRVPLPGPTWASPVVVDGVLLQGDCSGTFRAFDLTEPRRRPRQLWAIRLGGCIEATPAVWRGRIYVGTRGGAMYSLGGRTGLAAAGTRRSRSRTTARSAPSRPSS